MGGRNSLGESMWNNAKESSVPVGLLTLHATTILEPAPFYSPGLAGPRLQGTPYFRFQILPKENRTSLDKLMFALEADYHLRALHKFLSFCDLGQSGYARYQISPRAG
jgi:hypothetical protein